VNYIFAAVGTHGFARISSKLARRPSSLTESLIFFEAVWPLLVVLCSARDQASPCLAERVRLASPFGGRETQVPFLTPALARRTG
jgi:hypothetical protein